MNGYISIIILLSASQFVYDASIVMVVFPGGRVLEFTYIALRSMSGLWATLLTNVLSCVIVYTALTLQSYDIKKNLQKIILVIFVPSMVCGLLVPTTLFSSKGEDSLAFVIVSTIYGVVRIASIVFNIVCYFLLRKKLSMIKKKSPTSMQLTPAIDTPLHALAARFKYYPIIQVISRLGVSYYENNYGHEYEYDKSSSLHRKLSLFWYVISLPSAGFGFFLVFLVVTPGAYRYFRKELLGICWKYKESELETGLLSRYEKRSRSTRGPSQSGDYGYRVMRHVDYSSDFLSQSQSLSQYSEWSEQELSDEMSACLSKNSDGEYVMETEDYEGRNDYLSFYDNEKQLIKDQDDHSVPFSVVSGLTNDGTVSTQETTI